MDNTHLHQGQVVRHLLVAQDPSILLVGHGTAIAGKRSSKGASGHLSRCGISTLRGHPIPVAGHVTRRKEGVHGPKDHGGGDTETRTRMILTRWGGVGGG